jgi:hypothetical protein
LTGGIREGAKGEPPVAYFHTATARYSPTAPRACLVEPDCSRFRLRRLLFQRRRETGDLLFFAVAV